MPEGINLKDIEEMQKLQELGLQPQYADVSGEKPEEKFLEQLNPNKVIEEIENKLRCKRWDSIKQEWVNVAKIEDNSKITEEGIAEIMTRVSSIINTNTIYSNLDDEVIQNIVIDFGVELSRFLSLNYKSYNMKLIDINKITNFCCNMCYIALKRGDSALTLRMLRTMIQSKELTTHGIQAREQKQGIINKIFGK